MKARTALTLVFLVGLTACSRVATHPGSPQIGGNPWTIHGELRMRGTQTPDNLNSMLGALGPDVDLASFWGARLLIFDDHETLQPELALQEPTLRNRGISRDGRQALAYAIDMPKIIHVATHDVHLRADSDQPPWRWSHASGLPRYDYNPEVAANLLDAAGWHAGADGLRYKNQQPLRLLMVGAVGNATQDAAQLVMQQEWRAAGVDVSIKNVPTSILYALGTGVMQSGKFDIAFEAFRDAGDPDHFRIYSCVMVPPKGWNTYHYCNPAVDSAEAVARASSDRRVRKAAYDRVQRALTEDLPFYVLWFDRDQDIANSDFRGYRPGTTASAFWNVWEWTI